MDAALKLGLKDVCGRECGLLGTLSEWFRCVGTGRALSSGRVDRGARQQWC